MEPKEFQRLALERVDLYLTLLREQKAKWERRKLLAIERPDDDLAPGDFTDAAWKAMYAQAPEGMSEALSPRESGCGEPVPNFTLKVPTGGGKTYLAVLTLVRIFERYLDIRGEKLVLWVMPSEAIYRQTELALKNQDHPYRRILDVLTGNRVRILDKESPLHRADLTSHLCIMLLMLPSAAREKSVEKLKVFRDRGNINGFLPDEDDSVSHQELLKRIPNLDTVSMEDALYDDSFVQSQHGLVRSSLGNALRIARPVIVLDEGHKGYSELAHKTLFGFNPSVVIELTATPKTDAKKRSANCLVTVTGEQLHDEEMIKLPVMVRVAAESDRLAALRDAWQQTEVLQRAADHYLANGGDYVRPILLVQVERTGQDQVDEDFLHSEDVRQWLIDKGVPEQAIAIKTSEQNDLKEISPRELVSERCPIRVIITKQALQEGWDCPFAYVLCSLAVNKSASAMTQLVGRILRQPRARRTGIAALDQCYVFTNRVETKMVLDTVKRGLEEDGLGDLGRKVVDGAQVEVTRESRKRREGFGDRKYYLPRVLKRVDQGSFRELDWETDLLGQIDWIDLCHTVEEFDLSISEGNESGTYTSIGLRELRTGSAPEVITISASSSFDTGLATRLLDDFVPNAFVARKLIEKWLQRLRAVGWTDDDLGARQSAVIDKLISCIKAQVDRYCRVKFESGLQDGSISFRLETAKWWEIPETEDFVVGSSRRRLRRDDDTDLQKSLFDPIYEVEVNKYEGAVACFLDRSELVAWWYRNAVKGSAYAVQGWRRNRIYPDFIVSLVQEGGRERWLILETKGDQLVQNADSVYKRAVFDSLSTTQHVGSLQIRELTATYRLAMVAQDEWKERLSEALRGV